jgi:YggT family protein
MVLDAVSNVEQFVDIFIGVYLLVIFLYILATWVRLPYSLNPVQRFLDDVCGPYLRLWRRILPLSAGPLDFSPIAAIFGLIILREILDALLNRLH